MGQEFRKFFGKYGRANGDFSSRNFPVIALTKTCFWAYYIITLFASEKEGRLILTDYIEGHKFYSTEPAFPTCALVN
jgi:hypothetical protein